MADQGVEAQLQQLRNKLIYYYYYYYFWFWEGSFTSSPASATLVHERHGALGLVAKDAREKLQRQMKVYGHKDVGGVDHHGDGGEEDWVEYGLLPGLQHIDASDEQVLVVKPGQVLPQAFEAHLATWTKARDVKTTGAWRGQK